MLCDVVKILAYFIRLSQDWSANPMCFLNELCDLWQKTGTNVYTLSTLRRLWSKILTFNSKSPWLLDVRKKSWSQSRAKTTVSTWPLGMDFVSKIFLRNIPGNNNKQHIYYMTDKWFWPTTLVNALLNVDNLNEKQI